MAGRCIRSRNEGVGSPENGRGWVGRGGGVTSHVSKCQ